MYLCLLPLFSCNGNDSSNTELPTMSIKSCFVIENNNQSENFSSPIGLYILTEDKKPYDKDSYKNFASLIHGNWQVNTPVYITGKGLVYAYYPYRTTDSSPLLAINMGDQDDLLYCKVPSPIEAGNSAPSLKLSHALSQIVVTVENEEIVSISLTSPLTGSFNICSGIFTDLVHGKVSSPSGQLLVIPHIATQTEMKIQLKNGNEYRYAISHMEYVAGENYTYQFKLNASREKLEFTSVTVEDWINDFVFQDYLK